MVDAVTSPQVTDEDVLIADINSLSGHLDACLDQLGHTDVSSLAWLRDFQAQQRAAITAHAIAAELERIAERMALATGEEWAELIPWLSARAGEWREGKR